MYFFLDLRIDGTFLEMFDQKEFSDQSQARVHIVI